MAFVRVGQFKALPERVEELRAIYEAEAIPAIRAARGNISAVLLQQHQARNAFMAITVWDTAEDAERFPQELPHGGVVQIAANHYCVGMHPDTAAAIDQFLPPTGEH